MVHGAKGIGLRENVLDEKNDLVLNEASGKFVVGDVFFPMGNSAGSKRKRR